MFVLNKVTVAYSPQEDRIRLCGQAQCGEKLCLWLTNRLVRQLMSYLLEMLPSADDAPGEGSVNQVPIYDSEQSFNTSEGPVILNEDSPEFLIHVINLTVYNDGFILTFGCGDDCDQAVLRVSHQAYQKIIEAFRSSAKKAGWEIDKPISTAGGEISGMRARITVH